LLDCSALLAAALTAPARVVANSSIPFWQKRSFRDIRCSAFVSEVNTAFHIEAAAGRTIQVTLAAVKVRQEKPLQPGQRPAPDAGNEKFSLFFSGSRGDLMQQNTYSLTHEKLGRFEIFLVPIYTRNHNKIDYQVVVNRPRNQIVKEKQNKG
jgi:hypothetical protein